MIPSCTIENIEVFATDLAVVGGRGSSYRFANRVFALFGCCCGYKCAIEGNYFPGCSRLARKRAENLQYPPDCCAGALDRSIISAIGCERATTIHGFKGRLGWSHPRRLRSCGYRSSSLAKYVFSGTFIILFCRPRMMYARFCPSLAAILVTLMPCWWNTGWSLGLGSRPSGYYVCARGRPVGSLPYDSQIG